MKKLIISAVVVVGAIFGVYAANQSNNEVVMSDLQIENVEALADRGDNNSGWKCPGAAMEYVEPEGTYPTGRREDGLWGKPYTNPGSVYHSYNCMCEKITYVEITRYCK